MGFQGLLLPQVNDGPNIGGFPQSHAHWKVWVFLHDGWLLKGKRLSRPSTCDRATGSWQPLKPTYTASFSGEQFAKHSTKQHFPPPPPKVIYLESPDKFNCLKFEIKQRGTWEGYQGKRVEEMKSGQWDMNPWHCVLDTTSQNTIAGVSLGGNI